ncbi:Glycosyl transferase family 2 [Butyrivibrio sp. ob235]|uniref:glycosyltransferase family 2 protein n=1 Tax=Butyrivibrio sp. ob235 TaxID=1761780 RepID=UPI0008B23602|nr:glycosyltransferase family 2 protein [Butyrivibrio sp. ob235]SEL82224.1 Glycosyl transferase family 2 [Butyrivibrio sp. ob235]
MPEKLVSVIIPVYNIKEYFKDCIESVINQTYRDIEIILVDDGASDGSEVMCDDYAAKDERIRVIHKKNGGLVSAWSAGVKEATGHYVMFIDGDDWVDTDMVESLLEFAKPNEGVTEIISSNYIIEKKNEKRKASNGMPVGTYSGAELREVRTKLLGEENRPVIMSRCMKLITRDLILNNMKYLNYDIRMAEDVNIMLPCLLDVDRLVIHDGFFYHYRTIGTSMAHGYDERLLDNIRQDYDTFSGIMKDKGVSNGKEQMDREYVRLLFFVMKNLLRADIPGVTGRVREIFDTEPIRGIIKNTPVTVSEKSNKLLYFGMKHPIAPVVLLIKMIIRSFDRVTAGAFL